jgi:hypothetical protein
LLLSSSFNIKRQPAMYVRTCRDQCGGRLWAKLVKIQVQLVTCWYLSVFLY